MLTQTYEGQGAVAAHSSSTSVNLRKGPPEEMSANAGISRRAPTEEEEMPFGSSGSTRAQKWEATGSDSV